MLIIDENFVLVVLNNYQISLINFNDYEILSTYENSYHFDNNSDIYLL